MSPSQFHAKKEITSTNNNINGLLPPPLKISKESHLIKKSSSSPPSSSSSSSSSTSSSSLVNNVMTQAMPVSSYKQPPPQQRHPVIIYTHSPKVIHTHPKDFMQLVQKLTGLSRLEEDGGHPSPQQPPKQQYGAGIEAMVGDKECERKNVAIIRNEDETSSVITEENNCSSSMGENQVNSCFMARENPILEHPLNPYMTNLSVLTSEFACSNQSLLNYSDSLFFSHNMRTSIPSSLEGVKEIREQ
ncbi:VQ motif-containing protein 20 [Cajanus cajan]|uniref:VQ domain-containing protein n=1 Tax=Cajanus cajan TaxID=3821 RepID=A0A151TRV1_CAJCA|nr:VQ motif-containing protein 20 [Cajanus cajan]KYP69706.1 hypothetical protein KK1_008907 [Cajanus cajan]